MKWLLTGINVFLFFFVFFFGASRKTFWHRWKNSKVQENVGLNSRWSLQRGLAGELLNLVAISVHLKALSYLFCVGQPPGIFSYLPTILSFLDTNVNTTPLYLQPEWTINERNGNWCRVYISKIILTLKFALCTKEVFTYLYSFPCLRKAEKFPRCFLSILLCVALLSVRILGQPANISPTSYPKLPEGWMTTFSYLQLHTVSVLRN